MVTVVNNNNYYYYYCNNINKNVKWKSCLIYDHYLV